MELLLLLVDVILFIVFLIMLRVHIKNRNSAGLCFAVVGLIAAAYYLYYYFFNLSKVG